MWKSVEKVWNNSALFCGIHFLFANAQFLNLVINGLAVNAKQACCLALVSVCLLQGLLYAFALIVLVMKRERWLLLQGRSHGL